MVMSFKQFIQKGLDAQLVAKSNREEIDSVTDDLGASLREVTSGKVGAKRVESAVDAFMKFGKAFSQDLLDIQPRRDTLIVFNIVDPTRQFNICSFRESVNGYPLSIYSANRETICANKEELEGALSELFSLASVGEKIANLMTDDIKTDEI